MAEQTAVMRSVDRAGGITYSDLALFGLLASLGGTALQAYNVGPVPIQWLAQLLIIGTALVLAPRHLYKVPGGMILGCLLGWAAVVTLANAMLRDFGAMMPAVVTSPYPVFVLLRFLSLLSFTATVVVAYAVLVQGQGNRLARMWVTVGLWVAVLGLYVYVAQLYGLWEPVRSRIGTGGGVQATQFSYAFHRAMGTFREPSQLAEWLVAPFFLSFAFRGRTGYVPTLLMGSCLLLTGSLTGIVGVAAGLVGAVLLLNPLRRGSLVLLLKVAATAATGLLAFRYIAVGYGAGGVNLIEVIWERFAPLLLEDGMSSSNRSYVYEYFSAQRIPLLGAGLGNANLVFAEHVGVNMVVSFVGLYFNVLFSLGLIGLLLLALVFTRPVVILLLIRKARQQRALLVVLAAYLAWVVMFAVHSEELSVTFGILLAMLSFETHPRRAGEKV